METKHCKAIGASKSRSLLTAGEERAVKSPRCDQSSRVDRQRSDSCPKRPFQGSSFHQHRSPGRVRLRQRVLRLCPQPWAAHQSEQQGNQRRWGS